MDKMTITMIISINVKPLWNAEWGVRNSEFSFSNPHSVFCNGLSSELRFHTLDFIDLDFLFRIPESPFRNWMSLPLMENSSPPSHHRVNFINTKHWISHTDKNPFIPSVSYEIGIREITIYIHNFPLPIVSSNGSGCIGC